MVAFVRYSKEKAATLQEIVAEVKRTAEWLGISGSVIQCYVFYYSINFLCNTFDWGSIKKKYNKQCDDPKYFWNFDYIPLIHPNEKPRWLNFNEGSPKFTIKVQEM